VADDEIHAGVIGDVQAPMSAADLQAQLTRRLAAERDYVDGKVETLLQRFADMDRATELLSATVGAVPTDLQKAIADVLRLMDERRLSTKDQFESRDRLWQSESSLKQMALAAALAAQEKAAAVQVETFSSQIRGLGERVDRTVDKNAELAKSESNALSARVTALGDQITRNQQQIAEILAGSQAVVAQRVDTRGGAMSVQGYVGMVVSILGVVIAAVAIIIATR
jgi:hypothetical protein